MNTGRFRKVGWLRATPFFRKRWRLSRFVWCIWHLITTCWVITCEIHLQKLAAQSKLSGSPKLFLFFLYSQVLLIACCFFCFVLIDRFWLPYFICCGYHSSWCPTFLRSCSRFWFFLLYNTDINFQFCFIHGSSCVRHAIMGPFSLGLKAIRDD